jgi:chromosome segregation ATPase
MSPFEESPPCVAVEFDDDSTSIATFRDDISCLKEALESKEREVWKISGERDALERTLAKYIDNRQPVVAFQEVQQQGTLHEKLDKIKVMVQSMTNQEEEIQFLKGELESSKKQKNMELSHDTDAQVDELKAVPQETQNKIEVLEQQGATNQQEEEIQHLKRQLEFKTKKVEEWKDTVEEKHDLIELLGKRGTSQEEEIERLKRMLEFSVTQNMELRHDKDAQVDDAIRRLKRIRKEYSGRGTGINGTGMQQITSFITTLRNIGTVVLKHYIN